jgi:F-type H+-transporting ATPase subunit b
MTQRLLTRARRFTAGIAAFLALGLGSAAVRAAEGGAESSGGMPQLDFGTYAGQLFWLFVSFIVLYLLMARVGLPRMASVLEERRLTIDTDLQSAEDAKREADKVMATYREALGEADRKAKQALAGSLERAQNDANVRLAALAAELDKQVGEAQAGIETAKANAQRSVAAIATDVAADLLAKLGGGITIDRARLEAAVGRSLER